MPTPDAAAIVVAAGSGTRFGQADKVLADLGGRPLICHVLDAVDAATLVTHLIVVVSPHVKEAVVSILASGPWSKPWQLVEGGETRQESVERGLAAVPVAKAIVAVHDGARPLATPALFDATIRAADEFGGAIAAIPVVDSLKRVDGRRVVAAVSREGLWAAQTPQSFRTDLLRRAFANARASGLAATDEAALVEAIGREVVVVEGSLANLKITRPGDLALAEALLAARQAEARR